MGSLLWGFIAQVAVEMALPALYFVVVWPLYRAAVIRFAVTGSIASFFSPFANIRLVAKHLGDFLAIFFFDLLILRLANTIVGGLLIAVGIGVVLVPAVSLPLYYWATGFLFGQVARKVVAGGDLVA